MRILNKRIISEQHKRTDGAAAAAGAAGVHLVDLSHTIEDGMATYPGLPGPIVCDYLTREASRATYAPGTEFHIGKIEMVANTGTYLDARFIATPTASTSRAPLDRLAEPAAASSSARQASGRAIDARRSRSRRARARRCWSTPAGTRTGGPPRYFEGHPFLTARRGRVSARQRRARSSASTR